MYADKQSRGGILEPPGICEVKYRSQEQKIAMHRLDPTLIELDDLLVRSFPVLTSLFYTVPLRLICLLPVCTPFQTPPETTSKVLVYPTPLCHVTFNHYVFNISTLHFSTYSEH